MYRVLIASVLTLHLLMSTGTAFAEGDLSLQQAVDIALKQNPNLLAARSEVDAAKANERGARALSNPEILVTPSIAGEAGSDEELFIAQPLEVNGQRGIRSRIARAEKEAVQASGKATERDVIRLVKQAYWDVVRAAQIVDVNKENVNLAESLYQAAKRQVDVGTLPGAQAIKTQVELTRARQDLAIAESDLAHAKASLNILLGRSPETSFEPSDRLVYNPLTLDVSKLKAVTESNRPEIAEARSLLSARQGEIKAAAVKKVPDLVLEARQEEFGGDGGLAIGISVPIFDWGSVKQEKRRAQASAEAQARRVEAVKNTAGLDVDSAVRDVHRTETLIDEYQQGVLSQAEQLADMAQKGYKAGATGYLEVLEAQRTLRDVKSEYYDALSDHEKALAQLEWSVGTDLSALSVKEAVK